jgi:hypothetical protein
MQGYGVAKVNENLSKLIFYLEQYGFFYRLIIVKIHCRFFLFVTLF